MERLGKEPDAALAEELGVTRQAVHYQRVKRGLPAFRGVEYPELYLKRIEDFVEKTDKEVAEELEISIAVVRGYRRKIGHPRYAPRSLSKLDQDFDPDIFAGKLSDSQIADKYGVPRHLVRGRRKFLGVAPRDVKSWDTRRKGLPWDEILPLLGTMPDTEIAARYKCSASPFQAMRRVKKIPAYVPPKPLQEELDGAT